MKKTLIILALFVGFTSQVKAQVEGYMCLAAMPFGGLTMFHEMLKDPCVKKISPDLSADASNDEYCACLMNNPNIAIDSAKDPAFTAKLLKNLDKEKLAERKASLDRLYRFLNYEVGLQEQKFGLTETNKQVGCTPEDLGSITSELDEDPQGIRSLSMNAKEQRKAFPRIQVAKGVELFTSSPESAAVFKKHLSGSATKNYSSTEKQSIARVLDDKTKSDQTKFEEIFWLNHYANERIAEENIEKKTNIQPIPSPYTEMFTAEFKQADARTREQFNRDHENTVKNACITYDVYKVWDSVPTGPMLTKWSSQTPEEISASFNAKNLENDPTTLNFLRRNPVLAKNVMTTEKSLELAKVLKQFAGSNQNGNPVNMVEKFADFLKEKIKPLNDNNEVGSILQCNLLARNYAAAADPAYNLNWESTEEQNNYLKVVNNVRTCDAKKSAKLKSFPHMDKVIKASALFDVFISVGDDLSPQGDKRYNDFIAQNCKGYKGYEDNYFTGLFTCKSDACKEKAQLASSAKRDRIQEAYYKDHPELGAIVKAVRDNTEKTDLKALANKTDAKKQKADPREKFDSFVKPLLDKRSIFDTSDVMASSNKSSVGSPSIADAVSQAQESYSNPISSPQVADSIARSHSSVFNTPETVSAPAANPGQYIPPFLDNKIAPKKENYVPEKISNIEEAKEALEEFDAVPEEHKDEYLSKTKEFLDQQDQTSQTIKELQKKISDFEQRPDSRVTEAAVAPQRAPASLPPSVSTATNSVSRSTGSSFAAPQSSQAGFAKLAPTASVSKAAASYDKALNQANEARQDSKSLSLVVEKTSQFNFVNSPVTSSNLVIGASLEPSDKLFSEISASPEAMKAYLAQNLKQVPEGKVVSIKCKGEGCQPQSNEILLVITKDSDDKFSIRSVSRETKVSRSHTIKNLNLEINKATNKQI